MRTEITEEGECRVSEGECRVPLGRTRCTVHRSEDPGKWASDISPSGSRNFSGRVRMGGMIVTWLWTTTKANTNTFMKDYFLPKAMIFEEMTFYMVLFVPKVKATNYGITSLSCWGLKILILFQMN